jgi:hypothetical protein
MVLHSASLGRTQLGSANIHTAVELHGIGIHYFGTNAIRHQSLR